MHRLESVLVAPLRQVASAAVGSRKGVSDMGRGEMPKSCLLGRDLYVIKMIVGTGVPYLSFMNLFIAVPLACRWGGGFSHRYRGCLVV